MADGWQIWKERPCRIFSGIPLMVPASGIGIWNCV